MKLKVRLKKGTWVLMGEDSGNETRGIGILKRTPISPSILPKMQVCKESDVEARRARPEPENAACDRDDRASNYYVGEGDGE